MFGFLRRKKPAPDTSAAPEDSSGPAHEAPWSNATASPQDDAPIDPVEVGFGEGPAETPDAPGASDGPLSVEAATPRESAVTSEPAAASRPAGFFSRLMRFGAAAPATAPAADLAGSEPTGPEPVGESATPPAPAPEAAGPAGLGPASSDGPAVARAPSEPVAEAPAQTVAPAGAVPSIVAAPLGVAPSTAAPPVDAPPVAVSPVDAQSISQPPTLAPRAAPHAIDLEASEIAAPEPAARASWVARLKQGLSRTRSGLGTLFVGVKVDEALFEDLEAALLTADAGVEATAHLLARLRERVRKERLTEGEQVRRALKDLVAEMLLPLEQPIDIDRADPLVMMITGVNGAGKTTSIGKLARHLQNERKSVLLAAGDTFRAAAREQLARWGERNGVAVIAQQGGDPAAVAFDAVGAARARGTEVVIVDTAGRLPTQLHLMEELKKVRRVVAKAMPEAPHETLLVLDGNTGQNALAQVKAFDDAVPLTGLIVTKLDGTAKGGALIALAHTRRERPIPVYFIGVGEGIDDLQAFSSREFADALFD